MGEARDVCAPNGQVGIPVPPALTWGQGMSARQERGISKAGAGHQRRGRASVQGQGIRRRQEQGNSAGCRASVEGLGIRGGAGYQRRAGHQHRASAQGISAGQSSSTEHQPRAGQQHRAGSSTGISAGQGSRGMSAAMSAVHKLCISTGGGFWSVYESQQYMRNAFDCSTGQVWLPQRLRQG